MDLISKAVLIIVFASGIGNFSQARKNLKGSMLRAKERPKTFLQKVPLNLSALITVLIILGTFGFFEIEQLKNLIPLRLAGLALYALASWMQVYSFRCLGKCYSQEIVIFKNHRLIKSGIYGHIRHPQYLAQILCDLGAAIALVNYVVLPLALLAEAPLFIMRAKCEEKLLNAEFKSEFAKYKEETGFFYPKFIK